MHDVLGGHIISLLFCRDVEHPWKKSENLTQLRKTYKLINNTDIPQESIISKFTKKGKNFVAQHELFLIKSNKNSCCGREQ